VWASWGSVGRGGGATWDGVSLYAPERRVRVEYFHDRDRAPRVSPP